MSDLSKKLFRTAMSLSIACLLSVPAYAARLVNVTASLTVSCTNCQTDISDVTGVYSSNPSGPYSLQSDGSSYSSPQVESQILTNNSVYTLDTMNTLVNGLVGPGTRTVGLHFFSPVEGSASFPNDVLPACWGGSHDQDQAVNWSVFASNSVNFPLMTVGVAYPGFARMDFNVRNGVCDNQIYRFRLQWYNTCITRTSSNTWVVTSDTCGTTINYGTASLIGQGGKGQTVGYGDWRVPFKLTLVKP